MLSASITLHRKAKDGEKGNDGVGVVSANVLFAVGGYNNNNAADIKESDWKDTFSQLTLAEGKYVWSCTKTTYTKGNPTYTGKYCMGECYDFAEVTEMYALSDSGTTPPASSASVWNVTYTATKGKYLWTCSRVRYNANDGYQYIGKKCILYFSKDGTNGTSFTPCGTALAHYANYAAYKAANGNGSGDDVFLIDSSKGEDVGLDVPYTITFDSSKNECYDKAEVGDAYRIGTNLWVNNGSVWVNFGDIQGPKGDDGEDALEVTLSPSPVIFEADQSGQVSGSKRLYVVVKQGNKILKNITDYTITVSAGENFDLGSGNKNFAVVDANVEGNTTPSYNVFASGIATTKYDYNKEYKAEDGSSSSGTDSVTYPAPTSTVGLTIKLTNGTTYVRNVEIQVNFNKLYGGLYSSSKGLMASYGQLVGKDGRLSKSESNIKATADSIKLRVEKTEYDQYKGTVTQQFSSIQQQYNSISLVVSSTQQGLLDTGINITEGTIKLVADNFGIYNNSGEKTIGVDADGNLVTEGSAKIKGGIEATSGRVAGFVIQKDEKFLSEEGLYYGKIMDESRTDSHNYYTFGFSLTKSNLSFGVSADNVIFAQTGFGEQVRMCQVSSVELIDGKYYAKLSSPALEVMKNISDAPTSYENIAMEVNAVGKSNNDCTAVKASARGSVNNYAFLANNGDFKADGGSFIGGFCDKIMNVTDSTVSSTLIGDNISAIICKNTSKEIILKLPASPKTGMTFKVFQAAGNKVYFVGNGHNIIARGQDYPDGKNTWYTGTRNQMSIFIFDGSLWFVGFMNG